MAHLMSSWPLPLSCWRWAWAEGCLRKWLAVACTHTYPGDKWRSFLPLEGLGVGGSHLGSRTCDKLIISSMKHLTALFIAGRREDGCSFEEIILLYSSLLSPCQVKWQNLYTRRQGLTNSRLCNLLPACIWSSIPMRMWLSVVQWRGNRCHRRLPSPWDNQLHKRRSVSHIADYYSRSSFISRERMLTLHLPCRSFGSRPQIWRFDLLQIVDWWGDDDVSCRAEDFAGGRSSDQKASLQCKCVFHARF